MNALLDRPNPGRWAGFRPSGHLGMALAFATLAGCAGNPPVALEPVADSVGASAAFTELPAVVTDSAADEAALVALHELEFKSLTKGADHVRGVVPDANHVMSVARGSRGRVGGGTAAADARYDIDFESYASRRRVQYYIDYFLGPSRDRFTIWLGRKNRYEGMILEVLHRYGLPEGLLYLALIESGYSNTAVSRARAVGMWQFIRSTGRNYGLRIDGWVDERRDPFKSTDAAARHLLDLKEQLGSWYLAVAGYNGGAGRVMRGIARLETGDVTDETFFDLAERRWLRRETRDYVPKLIAATIVAKDMPGEWVDSVPVLDPLVFDEITVPDQTGLDVIATLADTTFRALQELNPHFFRGVTPPNESVTVRVPRGAAPTVVERYAALPVDERVNFIEHVVRRGETLSEIAVRYRISLSFVRAANPNVRARSMRIGQRLVIPLSQAARRGAARPVAAAAARRAAVPTSGYHTIRRGESLWIVSQRYGVQVKDLRAWNDIAEGDTLLRTGQRLRVVP